MSGRFAFAALTGIAAIVFTLFPQIDLWVAGLFWRPDAGFFLGASIPVRVIYRAVPIITYVTLAFAVVSVLAGFLGRTSLFGCNGRAVAYLVLALAIGPGFLANTVLKDHWGRARPSQVTEFGGTKNFTPPLAPSAQCERNCSFVSGHAALGFYLVSFAFLVPLPRRRYAIAAALALGGLFGLARIAQGGHFLSDVVFAGILVFASSWLLHRIVVVNGLPAPRPSRRALVGMVIVVVASVLSVLLVDRPAALFFHAQSDTRAACLPVHHAVRPVEMVSDRRRAALARPARGAARAEPRADRPAPRGLVLSAALFLRVPRRLGARRRSHQDRRRPHPAEAALRRRDLCLHRPRRARRSLVHCPRGIRPTPSPSRLRSPRSGRACLPLAVVFAGLVAASRFVITAHYVSDVIIGAYIAFMVTRYVEQVFVRSGVPIAAARAGLLPPRAKVPWRTRFGLDPAGDARLSDSP